MSGQKDRQTDTILYTPLQRPPGYNELALNFNFRIHNISRSASLVFLLRGPCFCCLLTMHEHEYLMHIYRIRQQFYLILCSYYHQQRPSTNNINMTKIFQIKIVNYFYKKTTKTAKRYGSSPQSI